jgi:hypothetical protein
LLLYFEKNNDRQKIDGGTARYRRHVFKDWKGEAVDEIASEYGVFQKSLIDDSEAEKLGVRGTEIIVKNLKSEHVVAKLSFFTSSRHRMICGHSKNGSFSVADFVIRSLNITEKFPSAFSQDPMKEK